MFVGRRQSNTWNKKRKGGRIVLLDQYMCRGWRNYLIILVSACRAKLPPMCKVTKLLQHLPNRIRLLQNLLNGMTALEDVTPFVLHLNWSMIGEGYS